MLASLQKPHFGYLQPRGSLLPGVLSQRNYFLCVGFFRLKIAQNNVGTCTRESERSGTDNSEICSCDENFTACKPSRPL
jgi:hypothetical protein